MDNEKWQYHLIECASEIEITFELRSRAKELKLLEVIV